MDDKLILETLLSIQSSPVGAFLKENRKLRAQKHLESLLIPLNNLTGDLLEQERMKGYIVGIKEDSIALTIKFLEEKMKGAKP